MPGSAIPSLSLSHPFPHQVFIHADGVPQTLLFSRLNSPSTQLLLVCQMLQTFDYLCSPSLDPFQFVPVSPVLGSPELDPVLQMWLSAELTGGEASPPSVCW